MTEPEYEIIATGAIELRHAINPDLERRIAAHNDAIEHVWNSARSLGGVILFNGTLLTYTGHTTENAHVRITGHFAEYKHYIAQRANPDLGLDIKPIGVSGMIIGASQGQPFTVFARRAPNISTYGGFLELVPSGAIDLSDARVDQSVDYAHRLKKEFEEEVGPLNEHAQFAIAGFAFLYDIKGGVYDVCCRVQTSLKPAFFINSVSMSEEYSDAVCVPLNQVRQFIQEHGQKIVPTSIGIIEAFLSL
jgi:hypothetical protein